MFLLKILLRCRATSLVRRLCDVVTYITMVPVMILIWSELVFSVTKKELSGLTYGTIKHAF